MKEFVWAAGPISANLPNFRAVRVAPAVPTEPWIYMSNGAWEVASRAGPRLEFLLMAPKEDPIHVETLAMVANFHQDPKYRVDLGTILDIGRPWIDGSTCDHLLVSLPHLQGPSFEYCSADGITVRCLWLLPITPSEAAFANREGVEALEEVLERAAPDVLNPERPAVV